MCELRHGGFPAKGAVEHHVQRCAGQPFLAAYDVGDFHQMIVDDVGQMVCGHAVGLEEHLVVKQTGVHGNVSADEVMDSDVYVFGEPETDYIGFAGVYAALRLLHSEAEAVLHLAAGVAVILESLLLGLVFFTFGLEGFGAVEGVVGPSVGKQLVGILAVESLAVALAVRAEGATYMNTLIELYSQPVEGLDDVLFGTGYEAGLVGVFDSENHLTVLLAGEEVVIEGSADAADVEWPRGRRGKTDSYHLLDN